MNGWPTLSSLSSTTSSARDVSCMYGTGSTSLKQVYRNYRRTKYKYMCVNVMNGIALTHPIRLGKKTNERVCMCVSVFGRVSFSDWNWRRRRHMKMNKCVFYSVFFFFLLSFYIIFLFRICAVLSSPPAECEISPQQCGQRERERGRANKMKSKLTCIRIWHQSVVRRTVFYKLHDTKQRKTFKNKFLTYRWLWWCVVFFDSKFLLLEVEEKWKNKTNRNW